eukprot:3941533-Rhodomonas_salina.2
MLLAAMFSLSNAIKKVTRFTEELFSVLISVIFIYSALDYFVCVFASASHGAGWCGGDGWVWAVTNGEVKAGLIVGLLTLFTALGTRNSRNGSLFTQCIRNRVADFAPVIAIAIALALAWSLLVCVCAAVIGHYGIEEVDLDMLKISDDGISSTTLGTEVRPWIVDWGDIDGKGIGLAVVGGLFGFIVMYLDQHITVRLVNAREHKLKKGFGYDMDMMALDVCTLLLSIVGCPWMVFASAPPLQPRPALLLASQRSLQLPLAPSRCA